MLTIEKAVLPSPEQWEIIIEGMRNPMNSWDLMDSLQTYDGSYIIGENDHRLMMNLAKGGAVHAKYRRMIPVWVTINAPLYWWKEADTYTVGKVQNSCSTMHKIHAKEFTMDDFSHEHLAAFERGVLTYLIDVLNWARDKFLDSKQKNFWWQMIQLLPSSYNQKRTVFLNYEVLAKMYTERRHHKLDEWHVLCDWIEQLPHAELMIGETHAED
jgi:hypothetical protein